MDRARERLNPSRRRAGDERGAAVPAPDVIDVSHENTKTRNKSLQFSFVLSWFRGHDDGHLVIR
jgi:hypothetical protein